MMDYEEDVNAIITLFSSHIFSLNATWGAVANSRHRLSFTAVKPAAVQKNTVKPAAIEIMVRVY